MATNRTVASKPIGPIDIPAELLVNIMRYMPDPETLLCFLNASPCTHARFRLYHRKILQQVLTTSVLASVEIREADMQFTARPTGSLSPSQFVEIMGSAWMTSLEVPPLREPMATLLAVVHDNIPNNGSLPYLSRRIHLIDRGADRKLVSRHIWYWMLRVREKDAQAAELDDSLVGQSRHTSSSQSSKKTDHECMTSQW